jgi:transcriptional regulator with XRE-family HTH domain
MAKQNIATTLIPEARQALELLGSRLRASRIDQNLTIAQMAEKMLCAINTYRDLEAGKSTASLGNFANALWLLGQLETLNGVAPVSATLAAGRRAKRVRSGNITLSSTDLDF